MKMKKCVFYFLEKKYGLFGQPSNNNKVWAVVIERARYF